MATRGLLGYDAECFGELDSMMCTWSGIACLRFGCPAAPRDLAKPSSNQEIPATVGRVLGRW